MIIPKDMIYGFEHSTKNGIIVILEYIDRNNVEAMFKHSGYRFKFKSQAVREGRVIDRLSNTVLGVARIGDGPYRNTINYKTTKEYKCWVGMIYRCYSSKVKAYKYYGAVGVTVCDEWLNFQNFAKWYVDNYPNDGGEYQLDKDFLSGKVKSYSPESCVFLTQRDNSAIAHQKTYTMVNPSGEEVTFTNMSRFCIENKLIKTGLHRVYTGGRPAHRGWRAVTR